MMNSKRSFPGSTAPGACRNAAHNCRPWVPPRVTPIPLEETQHSSGRGKDGGKCDKTRS